VASRPVKPKDLQRFLHYTSMVRTLRVSWLPDATCHAALELSCPTPLLPNLRRLEWGLDASSQRFHQILFFLSPTIVCLHIHIPSVAHALSLLPRLPVPCPGVRDIRLQGITRNTVEDRLASNAVCQWEGLSNEDLPRLASVLQLAELTLYCPHSGVKEIPRVGCAAFPALRSLSICPTFMEYGVLLIRAIPKLRLQRGDPQPGSGLASARIAPAAGGTHHAPFRLHSMRSGQLCAMLPASAPPRSGSRRP
ncbi:hypothetical protein K525DRAFT_196315, partial [Schizophyllum commune Loenen D]